MSGRRKLVHPTSLPKCVTMVTDGVWLLSVGACWLFYQESFFSVPTLRVGKHSILLPKEQRATPMASYGHRSLPSQYPWEAKCHDPAGSWTSAGAAVWSRLTIVHAPDCHRKGMSWADPHGTSWFLSADIFLVCLYDGPTVCEAVGAHGINCTWQMGRANEPTR